MSHFSDSVATITGFAVTSGAIVDPVTGGVLADATSLRWGGATALGYVVLAAGFVGWIFLFFFYTW